MGGKGREGEKKEEGGKKGREKGGGEGKGEGEGGGRKGRGKVASWLLGDGRPYGVGRRREGSS